MDNNGQRWFLIGGGLILFGMIGWAIFEFYLTPSSSRLPEPTKVVKVTPEERSQSRELIKKAHQIKPPENGRFNPNEGRKRLELLSKALEKNPLNTELRRGLMQEYADGWGWYEGILSDTSSQKRIRELAREGLSLQIPWRERKKLVNEMIATTENMFGLGNYEARWQVAQENQYSDYWLKILIRRLEFSSNNETIEEYERIINQTEKKLEQYSTQKERSVDKALLLVEYHRGNLLQKMGNYPKALKIMRKLEVLFAENQEYRKYPVHIPIGVSRVRNSKRELLCLSDKESILKENYYETQKQFFGEDVNEWPKSRQKTYNNICEEVLTNSET